LTLVNYSWNSGSASTLDLSDRFEIPEI